MLPYVILRYIMIDDANLCYLMLLMLPLSDGVLRLDDKADDYALPEGEEPPVPEALTDPDPGER